MDCKHEFIGDQQGVLCQNCGLRLTAEEYWLHLHPSAPQEPEEQTVPGEERCNPRKPGRRKEEKP